MLAVTIGQVLEHVEQFEDLLAQFYKRISEDSPHDGVRLLTEYMSRHSHHIKDLLNDLSPEIRAHLLKVPLSYEPHVPDCHCFETLDLPVDADAQHVLDAAVLLDECLVSLYRQVARQPVERQVQDFFEQLIQVLEQDEIQLKKIKATNYF